MTSAKITNTYINDLVLPNNQTIPKGETVTVENWNMFESHNTMQAWVQAKVLLVSDYNNGAGAETLTSDEKAGNINQSPPVIGASLTKADKK